MKKKQTFHDKCLKKLEAVDKIMHEASFEYDNEGQIVIYTGFYETHKGRYVEAPSRNTER